MADSSATTSANVLRHSSIIENAPYLVTTDVTLRLAASSSSSSNSGSSAQGRKKQ